VPTLRCGSVLISLMRLPTRSTLFPYTTLFRSGSGSALRRGPAWDRAAPRAATCRTRPSRPVISMHASFVLLDLDGFQHAPIDGPVLAGDVARRVAEQERGDFGEFFRASHSPLRHALRNLALLLGRDALERLGLDEAGDDAVGADAVRRHLHRDRARQAEHAMLAGDVGRVHRHAPLRAHRAGDEDRPAL